MMLLDNKWWCAEALSVDGVMGSQVYFKKYHDWRRPLSASFHAVMTGTISMFIKYKLNDKRDR